MANMQVINDCLYTFRVTTGGGRQGQDPEMGIEFHQEFDHDTIRVGARGAMGLIDDQTDDILRPQAAAS